MPGDEKIRKSELYVFTAGDKKLTRVEPKWVDEGYTNITWNEDAGDVLRFIRRDRLLRNIELCSLNLKSKKATCLIEEGFENANIVPQSVRYLEDTDEMIWWSEKSGWSHFYLYDKNGKLKNPITSGEFRASRIVDVDEKNRLLYFTGNGREPDENVYHNHLYCVRFDGTGLKLMDPGNANHSSSLSKSKQYIVDNCSRVDMKPVSILRNADGKEIMKLEEADLSRLDQVGWRMPETFVVKAADGVTDLYGNMWKPFDFDEKKQYPIIAHVYPGPQQEGTRHTFSATAGEQQLAQLGFIVIQVGHRGGTPGRSKAYASYGYLNLRDYGLADKKAAIEQLAQKFPFIDVARVGIYGHSGGGFMTAAALMQKPYNDFFKVGVSTAGNHDNNIYNNSWSERYHGLKQVEVKETKKKTAASTKSSTEEKKETETTETKSAFQVDPTDYFYEYEMLNGDDLESLDRMINEEWWNDPEEMFWRQEQDVQDQEKAKKLQQEKEQLAAKKKAEAKKRQEARKRQAEKRRQEIKKKMEAQKKAKMKADGKGDAAKTSKELDDKKAKDAKNAKAKATDGKTDAKKTDAKKSGKKDDAKKEDGKKDDAKKEESKSKVKFEIKVPTNTELAANLKGHLFLIHGELDNNVHPANTLRLVDALIKANKRFDMMYLPATRHGFGQYQPYVTQRMYEYFAEHLLNDYQADADMSIRRTKR